MKRILIFLVVMSVVAPAAGQRESVNVTVATRLVPGGTRSLLVEVLRSTGPVIDELRIELPQRAAESAVLLRGPEGWRATRDGNWVRLAGAAASTPFRMRVALVETKNLTQVRVRARLSGRNLGDQAAVAVVPLPTLSFAGATAGLVQMPALVSPGETIEFEILNPARTPADGQWLVAGVPAASSGTNRMRVQIPGDLPPATGLRVSYFDVWGERLLDAAAVNDVIITARATPAAVSPRITGCSRYGLLGESICVCGQFPGTSWSGLTIDGQPASVVSASSQVVHVRLPVSLSAGPHTIAGTAASGFTATDTASTRAIRLSGSLDVSALLRGQSTMMRLAIEGAAEPLKLSVINRTPGVISIPGGNYQEIELPSDPKIVVERRVDARTPGNFNIDTRLLEPPCPCASAPPDYISTASQPAPVFVPRRILAMIAAATPAAARTTAQAIAQANGLALVDVAPLVLANQAMVVFEITDGLGALVKAAAVAASPNVTLAQPDFAYDTSQAAFTMPAAAAYGPAMIGADTARTVSTGSGIRVAVIDTGIDSGHARLQSRVVEYVDITGTGWTPDVHGTLVAGIIAAEGRDGAAAGVAPGAAIVGIKACVAQSPTQALARCWSSTLALAIDQAARMNVRVMNLSVGGREDPLLARMVNAAVARGISVVSAAGNDGPAGKPSFPAAMDNVIAVTAVDVAGRLYDKATRGEFVDVAAPGVDVLSTGPGGREQLFSGTSAATAFASGAVALLLQQRAKLTAAELRSLLTTTARDLGRAGSDAEFGGGLLDVCRAMTKLSGRQIPCR